MGSLSTEISPWGIYQKIGFRFAFSFVILFIVLLDWSVNPVLSYLYYEGGLAKLLDGLISWLGKNVFHIPYTIISPYDGQHNDRTYIYLLYFIMAAIAVVATVVWSVWDRKRLNYEVLYYWLTAIVRYYLAFTLFLFALEKFFKAQFPDIGLYTLTQPVGDMSPMELAWAFFGYSFGYNIFIGIAESAALLLLFRRTMTFGAILTLATLANVMAVNFNYDVHAKMYPTALFLMTLFLLAPSINRLFQFFFTNQATSLPVIQAPIFKRRWLNISKAVLKFLLIVYGVVLPIKDYWESFQRKKDRTIANSKFTAVYDVVTHIAGKDTLTQENPLRWNQVVLGGGRERIRLTGDSVAYMMVSVDRNEILVYENPVTLSVNEQKIFNEQGFNESTFMIIDSILIARQIFSKLHFELTDSGSLKINGQIKGDSVYLTAKKRPVEAKDFRLIKHQFHWITE